MPITPRAPLVALLSLLAMAPLTACQTSSGASTAQAPAAARAHDAAPADGDHGLGEGAHRGDHFADPERFAPHWNAPKRDEWQRPEEIVAALRLAPGATAVDLGAGTGYLIPRLAAAVGPDGAVIAADIEPAMLAYLEEAAAREGWTNVTTHAAAPDDPRLSPGSADAVVAINVWHHVGRREAYAAKVKEALKPGGAFVIVDYLDKETEGGGPPMHIRLSAEQVRAELEAGGLTASILEESLPRHYIVRGVKPAEQP